MDILRLRGLIFNGKESIWTLSNIDKKYKKRRGKRGAEIVLDSCRS